MAVDFRGHPMFPRGFNSPTRFEADVYDCEVWGEIPTDIEGTFYRTQCDFAYRPPQNEWMTGFNGDGHISAFHFNNGSVDYIGKYVKTERLLAERKARKRLFGVYRNHFTDDPSVADLDRSAANTHMYWHGGKLLVLKEDSPAWHVDPWTLETYGAWDFYGRYKATSMSAHPKIDPVTGEMIAYGYQAKGDLTDDVAVYTVARDGHITKEVWFKAPYVGIMHDIAITQNYIVVPLICRTTSLERLQSGEPMWEWNENVPTMVAVLPRDGEAKDVRWFRGPPRNTLHFLNATDRGDRITMELPCSDGERTPSEIKRWSFNMNSKNEYFEEETVNTANGVLARMDDRYLSLDYQYAYVGNRDTSLPYDNDKGAGMGGRVTNQYLRVDVKTGKTTGAYFVGPTHSLQESCFVPRKGGTAEGDGYLMGVANNYESMTSDLVIVDAQRMEEGAIATVKLPFRLRSGTHTNWFNRAELPAPPAV
ncbi:MAG: carotenoid oxygenase family protein [Gammaproteobacteria bacterium]|nr:carotenoid oxygenase family protein [Gammaproteobacteria bacterium]